MKMEKIDKYIEDEKAITPSPFLESRILARIENLEREQIPMPKRARLWPSVAVVAGIATGIAQAGAVIITAAIALHGFVGITVLARAGVGQICEGTKILVVGRTK